MEISCCRYKYEDVVNPWMANGAVQGSRKPEWKRCNPTGSPKNIAEMIDSTSLLQEPVNFTYGPLTFKVKRCANASSEDGEETLELRYDADPTSTYQITAFAFYPQAQMNSSWGCGEFLAIMEDNPHVGISKKVRPEVVWRMGIRRQLELMGRAHEEYLVVTLVGNPVNVQEILITNASVVYSTE